jgi:hypothetical protein
LKKNVVRFLKIVIATEKKEFLVFLFVPGPTFERCWKNKMVREERGGGKRVTKSGGGQSCQKVSRDGEKNKEESEGKGEARRSEVPDHPPSCRPVLFFFILRE